MNIKINVNGEFKKIVTINKTDLNNPGKLKRLLFKESGVTLGNEKGFSYNIFSSNEDDKFFSIEV